MYEYLLQSILCDVEVSGELFDIEISPQNWSFGGGVHFHAKHRDDGVPVFLKVGAYANELKWVGEVSRLAPELCPKLYGKGTSIADFKVGWITTEAMPYGTLGPLWKGAEFELLIDAAVKFQKIARSVDDATLPVMSLDRLTRRMEMGLCREAPGPAKEILERAPRDYEWVVKNSDVETCHGDLHLCNGLSRSAPPDGPVVLIDFQPIKQPWAMEAAYLQVLCSTDAARPGFRDLIVQMALARERRGMRTSPDIARLSAICLGWTALWRWGCDVERHEIPDYRHLTEEYLETSLLHGTT